MDTRDASRDPVSIQGRPDFDEHLRSAVQAIRSALIELFAEVGADATTPQAVARTYGLNKNLTWKLSKLVGLSDPVLVVPHIPGRAGIRILLKAMRRAGARDRTLASVDAAMDAFDQMIELHAGDRATLDLMLGSMGPQREAGEQAEATRKLAYQGNSAIWGLQARMRFASYFVAPHAGDPDRVDIALIGGLLDYRRLRPNITWPLFQGQRYQDDGSDLASARQPVPLDPEADPDGLPLIRHLCSDPPPEIVTTPMPDGSLFELAPGPVGMTAASTCIFGWMHRNVASSRRDARSRAGPISDGGCAPGSGRRRDLFVHDDLPVGLPPRPLLLGCMSGPVPNPALARPGDALPLAERVHEIGMKPSAAATPLIPEYPRMLEFAYERLGVDGEAFRGFRFVMKYPPIPSILVLRYDLGPAAA